jgi:hypothetical protein
MEHVEAVNGESPEDAQEPQGKFEARLKERDGVVLIPQPSDDPNDPLVRFIFSHCSHLHMLIMFHLELAELEEALCPWCIVLWLFRLLRDGDHHRLGNACYSEGSAGLQSAGYLCLDHTRH